VFPRKAWEQEQRGRGLGKYYRYTAPNGALKTGAGFCCYYKDNAPNGAFKNFFLGFHALRPVMPKKTLKVFKTLRVYRCQID